MKKLTVFSVLCAIIFLSCASTNPSEDSSENLLVGTWEDIRFGRTTIIYERSRFTRITPSGELRGTYALNNSIYIERYTNVNTSSGGLGDQIETTTTRYRITFNGDDEFSLCGFSDTCLDPTIFRRVE